MKSKTLYKTIALIAVVCAALILYVSFVPGDGDHDDDHAQCTSTHGDNDDHSDHEDDDEHSEHVESEDLDEHEGEEQAIELSAQEILEIGLKTALAGSATIDNFISLAGEIRINQDQMAHVVPRVGGVVTKVNMKLGDTVKTGQTIAVIESQGLADAKAGYLAAYERFQMAKLSFDREENLWKEKISSEQDYLDKKQALTEASIAKRVAEQKLHAIGFDKSYLAKLPGESEQLLTKFEIKAPFKGTIIEKHIVLGELVSTDSPVCIVADLTSVWVDLQVYPMDLKHIKKGQQVAISTDSQTPDVRGTLTYVGPIVGAESRTALARVVLANNEGTLRPGLFVTAQVAVSKTHAKIVVHKDAIQSLEGKKCVFVKDAHGFEPVFVKIGVSNASQVEILSGLSAGDEYVTKGAFTLKSKIVTSTLDSHAGHGH